VQSYGVARPNTVGGPFANVSAYLAAMHLGQIRPEQNVSSYLRGVEWLNLSIFEPLASGPSAGRTIKLPTPTGLPTANLNICANTKTRNRRKPATISIGTGSKQETADEISGR
jgi:hypothetical protein